MDSTVHRKARRINIPTAELESFAEEDERRPQTLLYPRDPSLDPQLVWKGKDEQDRADLAVPAVPIYIQEKIQPRALIDDLLAEKKRSAPEQQIDLYGDFNGLEFDQLIEFYRHPMKWQNRMILGDSLLVMTSLAEKEGLRGKVQTIYLDPPYGVKFGSNWQVSTRQRDVKDGKADDATRQPEQIRAFRDTWLLGIHSYLAYMRDRLVVARSLLNETGSIFVQIGVENSHLVRGLIDEVFGSANFVAEISYRKTSGLTADFLAQNADHIHWYAKDRSRLKYRQLYVSKGMDSDLDFYSYRELPDGSRIRPSSTDSSEGRPFAVGDLTSSHEYSLGKDVFKWNGRSYGPGGRFWTTSPEGMKRLGLARRLHESANSLRYVRFMDDFPAQPLTASWTDTITGQYSDPRVYVVQTTTLVVERCILMTTDPGDLVLDPTCGAGTTAYVAEQWGRRWITIDTSRVALALARTRLMAARYPYYLLADTPEGQRKEAELTGQPPLALTDGDIGKGFVYERISHITLKSIAQNSEIREGMTRSQIDAAIARRADRETLYDRPYTNPKIVRVTGPFTVESLSPHRFIPVDGADGSPLADADPTPFIDRILQNLRKAGVQNTVKDERLVFDRLEQWPGGVYVQAAGEYSESGLSKTVAVCIGPEYGTVGQQLVRDAAKEAIKFADLLVVCGFAFEAHVGDETTKLGRLTVLKAKMNPDLSMGDELLKKTGSGNLFMVFGEPDIAIESVENSQVTVEIRGVDTYNPTTGEIRSDTTDEIACWFVDTDYNGESFFVRHAYFLGTDDPYTKLKQALRAEIDQGTWSTLHSAKSRPFPKPATGKIAVKVINHYGDEVLKVYPI